jgi:hypothetical protein
LTAIARYRLRRILRFATRLEAIGLAGGVIALFLALHFAGGF